jgi:hypothetical protein
MSRVPSGKNEKKGIELFNFNADSTISWLI